MADDDFLPWVALNVDAASLAPGQRVLVKGRTGRTVVVLRAFDGDLSCLDHHCFHAGAALGSGALIEIEEIGTVLECPAHGYRVSVRSGERVASTCPAEGAEARWEACGQRVQRIHPTRVDPCTGKVLVQIGACGHSPSVPQ
uniref:Rieske domain-containing protein n=1 Tax=Haptolina ericina TaxID=156174 RepID=A0A7S3FM37_9EUKA